MKVAAAPSRLIRDSYLYAVEIADLTANTVIKLRNAAGIPLWTGPGAAQQGEPGDHASGGCVDHASIRSVTATLEAVNAGVGIQMPTLTLKAGTELVTMKIGPEWILLAKDFELKAGDTIQARYGTATCSGESAALQLTNAGGVTVTLREDDETPVWNR